MVNLFVGTHQSLILCASVIKINNQSVKGQIRLKIHSQSVKSQISLLWISVNKSNKALFQNRDCCLN